MGQAHSRSLCCHPVLCKEADPTRPAEDLDLGAPGINVEIRPGVAPLAGAWTMSRHDRLPHRVNTMAGSNRMALQWRRLPTAGTSSARQGAASASKPEGNAVLGADSSQAVAAQRNCPRLAKIATIVPTRVLRGSQVGR
jgi:hypothetical protein